MLKIREEKLQDLLFRRRKHIKTRIPILETVAFVASLSITLLLSDFPNASAKVKVLVSVLSIVYTAAYILTLYGSNYSLDAFFQDICSVAEKERSFSLILLRDTSDLFPASYLLRYDRRWKCWLFPYVRTSSGNDSLSVSDYIKSVFKIHDFEIKKTAEQDFTKHSVSANMQKTYHHTFYLIGVDSAKTAADRKSFSIGGEKYRWLTVPQMKASKRIAGRNSDVIRYVEETFGY